MTLQLGPEHFVRPDTTPLARVVEGLCGRALDEAAGASAGPWRFLRHGWFAAAQAAYGGVARTVVVERGGRAMAALPLVRRAPGLAQVPGCYWPLRGFPIADDADDGDLTRLLNAAAAVARAVRIGPAMDDDPLAARLAPAARAGGWTVLERLLGTSWRLDLAHRETPWPGSSTAKKTRYFARQLEAIGALEFTAIGGTGWTGEALAAITAIERASWVSTRAGGDAKFASGDHGALWRAALADPALAAMLRADLLRVGGRPAAFAFHLDSGARRYTIANSYDPAFARWSPGRVLGWHSLIAAREADIAEVEWGSGDSGYKAGFGAIAGPAIRDWLLVAPGAAALAARLAGGLIWR